jgi:hypothetical protein
LAAARQIKEDVQKRTESAGLHACSIYFVACSTFIRGTFVGTQIYLSLSPMFHAETTATFSSIFVLSIAQAFATAPANATAVVEAAVSADKDASSAVELALAFWLSLSSQKVAIAMFY